eukprot:Blabericola_migrator_1__9587@NODE_522_length_7878_cov_137_466778_g399_i0_p3_GENE_NODE_522_length_7878_cov_137_466778_g399_i0NODE_522_length_7878_cov_137_466778_g399_i0_p3_ORF_typecomplete_len477_score98_46TIP49/PF06068_13/4_7e149TIP49_C/PF17856_1/1_4e26RuvB_N/PF05496_12/9_1e09RuvB_N/PF05496_12/2_2e03RuvB_N/PF05496_12/1_4AAA/PF00004_29/9_9e08AAA/PF00004_29/0_68AAA_22/PF13401_6/0_0043AAA_22/PF13401_6/0_052AAA_16/PF13191_6/4_6e07AAA_5/PF07728_14/0_00069AAA_5/PF07728_14/5_1AAA_19/PF13245_6/7_6e06DNA
MTEPTTTIPAANLAPALESRIAAHTHIRGLGVDAAGLAAPVAKGMVGQIEAREAAALVVDLIRSQKIAGKAILLAGPPGTGKTAIALGMSRELGARVPYCHMSGAEIYSQEVKKTEVLMENMRRAIGLRIREVKEVYEGEIADMSVSETENPHGGYGKTVSAVMLTLKAMRGTKTLKLAPQIHENLQKEKVRLGDVIYIEAQSGLVKRLGRCDQYVGETDLETEEYVPLPKGDVFKNREVVQDVTLYDLDVANSKPQGGSDVVSIISQFVAPRKTEITDRLRREVDRIADKYISDGQAELTPGVLFIDEAHMLDIESFAFLNRAMESPHAPVLIFATNRGVCKVSGTPDMMAPHGIPLDFLDRLLIIKTSPYAMEDAMKVCTKLVRFFNAEILQIIAIRARTENVALDDAALEHLGSVGAKTSLRYALQLLTPASILAKLENRTTVTAQDIKEADGLFLDTKASVQMLSQYHQPQQ